MTAPANAQTWLKTDLVIPEGYTPLGVTRVAVFDNWNVSYDGYSIVDGTLQVLVSNKTPSSISMRIYATVVIAKSPANVS